jgi:Zn-dependent alcohol dehydrogenase
VNDYVTQALDSIRKGGICVLTAVTPVRETMVPMALFDLTIHQKRLQGALFGASNGTWDIPRQLQLYRDGALRLDEMVTTTYSLDEIDRGYQDLRDGRNLRGVVAFG